MFNKTKRILGKRVSLFPSIKSVEPTFKTLFDVLNSFRTGHYSSDILKIRELLACNNMKEFSIKKKKLPLIAFSGLFFLSKEKSSIFRYNNLMVLDFDNLNDNIINVRQLLITDPYIFALWTSPSGLGLKALIDISYDKTFKESDTWIIHEKVAFPAIQKYILQNYNLEIDSSGADVSRLCFVSFDPDIFLRNEYKKFEVSIDLESPDFIKYRNKYLRMLRHRRNISKKLRTKIKKHK